jgi:hypothetical protein
MSDRSEISSPPTSRATDSSMLSAGLESGPEHYETPDGLMICLSGPDQRRVSLGPVPAGVEEKLMRGTSGPNGSASSESAFPQLSLESKSPAKTVIAGSMKSPAISKLPVTAFQQMKSQQRRLERLIEGNASTSQQPLPADKKCSRCALVKPSYEFGTDTTRSRPRLRSECYECARLRHWRRREEKKKSGKKTTSPRSYQARENARSYSSLYRTRHPAQALIGHARNRARQKKLPFDLCEADILPILEAGRCQITGIEFVKNVPLHPRSPSLDRIMPKKGYVKGNVRLVLLAINGALGPWGLEELESIRCEWKKK